MLANCFVNSNILKCNYNKVLNKEIEKNCPDIFKHELRIPEFYLNIVKSKKYKST
jgi:hypothetical protein